MMPRVYGAFDQEQLDAQYPPGSMVGDIQPFLDDYAESSRLAQRELAAVAHRDLRFGPGPDDRLDVYGSRDRARNTGPPCSSSTADTGSSCPRRTPRSRLRPWWRPTLSTPLRTTPWPRAPSSRTSSTKCAEPSSGCGAERPTSVSTPSESWSADPRPAPSGRHAARHPLAAVGSARRPHRGRRAVRRQLRPDPGATDLRQRRRPQRRQRSPGPQPPVPHRCALPRRDRLGRARDGRVQTAVLRVRGAPAQTTLAVTAFEQPGRNHFDSPTELGVPSTRVHAETADCRSCTFR